MLRSYNFYTGSNCKPIEIATIFHDQGNYNADYGHGTDSGLWRKVAERYNLRFIDHMVIDEMICYLTQGEMIVACVGRGLLVNSNNTSH